jgi:hypothetical protein
VEDAHIYIPGCPSTSVVRSKQLEVHHVPCATAAEENSNSVRRIPPTPDMKWLNIRDLASENAIPFLVDNKCFIFFFFEIVKIQMR